MKKADKKILDYLWRANKIDCELLQGGTNSYEGHLIRVIEIAKMIQREETK